VDTGRAFNIRTTKSMSVFYAMSVIRTYAEEDIMQRFLLGICLALWPATASLAQTPVTIDLGPIGEVATLYSYPNCAEVCPVYRTLPQTIEHYLSHSLKRDGFNATTVDVYESAGRISVRLTGAGAAEYAKVLPEYLKAGTLGLRGARELLHAQGPDGRILWRYNWRFFLPHGVAMVKHRTVQLLHFPPDSVLLDKQDYLAASTTKRWAELLMENKAAEVDMGLFQNIIDIVPIALPDRESRFLDPRPPTANPTEARSGVYPHFDDYVNALLSLWLPLSGQAGSRPMIAFGAPARNWLKATHNVDLAPIKLGVVTLASGMKVQVLAANHPSAIWHVKDEPNTPQDMQLARAMFMMQQDLTAACWQVKMGMDATAGPEPTLSLCKQVWSGRDKDICELSYRQVFSKTTDEAKLLCANIGPDVIRSVSDAELQVLHTAY
jgi:hypothetical protein